MGVHQLRNFFSKVLPAVMSADPAAFVASLQRDATGAMMTAWSQSPPKFGELPTDIDTMTCRPLLTGEIPAEFEGVLVAFPVDDPHAQHAAALCWKRDAHTSVRCLVGQRDLTPEKELMGFVREPARSVSAKRARDGSVEAFIAALPDILNGVAPPPPQHATAFGPKSDAKPEAPKPEAPKPAAPPMARPIAEARARRGARNPYAPAPADDDPAPETASDGAPDAAPDEAPPAVSDEAPARVPSPAEASSKPLTQRAQAQAPTRAQPPKKLEAIPPVVPALPLSGHWLARSRRERADLTDAPALGWVLVITGLAAGTVGFGLMYDQQALIFATARPETPINPDLLTLMAGAAAAGLVLLVLAVVAFDRNRGRVDAELAKTPPLFRWLRESPDRVVWVYVMETTLMRGDAAVGSDFTLFVGYDTGALEHTPLAAATLAESAVDLEAVSKLTRHATLGYSEVYRDAFARSPSSLRRPWGRTVQEAFVYDPAPR